jgi:hypothetical protein
MNGKTQRVRDILNVFELGGDVVDVIPHKAGHINDTFIAATKKGQQTRRYTLQRINAVVFPRPDLIMHNIRVVTETIRKKGGETGKGSGPRPLTLVQTRQGESYHRDDDGAYWRCYRYVEGTTYNQVPAGRTGLWIAREAAAAFRRFGDHLSELDAADLHVTIEDFHNTPVRFLRLREAVAGDFHMRTRDASREIESALAREGLCGAITEPLARGHIPLRVTHNDTKINNVVFDDGTKQSPKALCVIDLDTVMPGSSLFDFGDLVRSSVCERSEDETDLDTVHINLKIFEALVGGFCTNPGDGRVPLTESERELMVTACLVITFETGLRFLTDYLMGDVYFRTERPRHNLDRARTQFRLLADMEHNRDVLEQIVMENAQW